MHLSRTPALAVLTAALVAVPGVAAASADAQVAAFPRWVDQINATPDLSFTVHVGDIKNGSSACTNEYCSMIRSQFDRFTMPLVYSPGDNEWTDCHRTTNGTYDPLERLAFLRQTLYTDDLSLGQKKLTLTRQTGY